MMDIHMDQAADVLLQAARQSASADDLSDVDVDVDVDGDGSSSLSEIEDKDGDQDEDAEASDDLSNVSDDENDSEAETERLEESPNKVRQHQDVVLTSHNSLQPYEPSPSKLHNQIIADNQDEEEDDDPLSSDDISLNDSPQSIKSPAQDEVDPEPTTTHTSLEDSAGENKISASAVDADTRKRKRSIMAGGAFEEDLEEPLRKRTGTIMSPGNDYAIEDDQNNEEDIDVSNPISGNASGDEAGAAQEDDPDQAEEPAPVEEPAPEVPDIPVSPKKRGRKKKKTANGVGDHEDADAVVGAEVTNGDHEVRNGEEDNADNEGDDEAEAATRNEEELERKRIALEQLNDIEHRFNAFRSKLYDERLEQFNREEAMLRLDKPTHPEYLAMMQAIDARRDERIRHADKHREYEFQTLRNYAVARRSQILTQFQQEVRELREKKLEQLGKEWYDIQHDRRSYAGTVPDFGLRFPTSKAVQIRQQIAYSNEVSILSGIAKYVGFPAAPQMTPASSSELEEDLEKMGRGKQIQQAQPASGLPLQELVALRNVSSTSRFKPAEEQFIEQTPWANPQHPSHAHLLQRQTSAQQTPRTTSPFSQVQMQPRRHSHQQASAPPLGTFSAGPSILHHSNGVQMSGGRVSPHNPFGNSNHSHTIAPSPLGSRQPSLSPQQNRHPSIPESQQNPSITQDIPSTNGNQHSPPRPSEPRDFSHDMRREQAAAMMSRF